MVDYHLYISINPEIRFGRPCITGTRISVSDVLSWLAHGMAIEEIIEDFPQLNREQILACLAFSADKERSLKIGLAA
jgi:uncharacterized protein (DUF433 family)